MDMENKYHTNVYERIIDIIHLLLEADGISVNLLASKYCLTQDIILEDIRYLYTSKELNFVILPCDENLDTDTFFDDLQDGKLNDEGLYAEQINDNRMITLQLSLFERIFMNNFLNRFNIKKDIGGTDDIFIKNTKKNLSWNKLKLLKRINEAINLKKELSIIYDENSKPMSLNIFPLNIVKMVTDETYCCVAQIECSICYIRLDKIIEIKQEHTSNIIMETSEYKQEKEFFEYRWGVIDDEGPFDFEMIVYNEANLPKRLHHELEHRKFGRWEQISEESFLYKDIVIDYESLKYWVLGLGSSVRVVKPKKLVDDIVKEAYVKLKMYSK